MLGKPSPVSFNPGPHTYRRGREVGHDGPILINGELAMGVFRLYNGGDGRSHIWEFDLSAHPEITSPLAASTINFREWPPGHFWDWLPAPRRQYIISRSGAIEIGLAGGRVHRFVPGGARLVEDATGDGHSTWVLGDRPSVDAVIPLA